MMPASLRANIIYTNKIIMLAKNVKNWPVPILIRSISLVKACTNFENILLMKKIHLE